MLFSSKVMPTWSAPGGCIWFVCERNGPDQFGVFRMKSELALDRFFVFRMKSELGLVRFFVFRMRYEPSLDQF